MQPEAPPEKRRLPWVALAVLVAVASAVAILALRGLDYRALGEQGLRFIRGMGPWTFFAATAILPAFGAPLSVFTITAGELFAPQMTMAGVIAATLAAIAVNLAFTYWLAHNAVRPILSKVIRRYGYSIPTVTKANALSIALAIRLTPGPPFAMQSYMLGLSGVPFRLYMVVSWLCILPWALGALVLGKGLFNGNFKLVIYGVGVIVVATLIVHAIRKRYVNRPS